MRNKANGQSANTPKKTVCGKVPIVIKKWMGPMGAFERYRAAGLDWFMLRWLVARNAVQFFCLVAAVISLIFG